MKIYGYDRWHPQSVNFPDDPAQKTQMFVHHSVGQGAAIDTLAEQAACMRQIEREHLAQGWAGIGYSFVVFQPHGKLRRARLFLGRGWSNLPAAQLNHNTGTIAVCVVGDFRYETVKNATISLLRAVAKEGHAHGIKTLGGHRDVTATVCPGDHLYAQLDRIVKGSGLVRYHK